MIKSIDDIKNNQFINNLDEIANEFSLYGTYVRYYSHTLQQENVYFICGRDKETVWNQRLDIDTLISDQKQQQELFRVDAAAFKVTGEDPLVTRQNLLLYCKNAHFVVRSYRSHDKPLPRVIRTDKLETLKMLHNNAENPLLSSDRRDSYSRAMHKLIHEPPKHESRDRHAASKLYYVDKSNTKPIKESAFKSQEKSKDHSNMVSLTDLVMNSNAIGTITVKPHIADCICQSLDNLYPEIVYWRSPPFGEKMQCPDNEGYGSKEENDRRFVRLVYEEPYGPVIFKLALVHEKPEAFSIAPQQMIEANPDAIAVVTIPEDDYKHLLASCSAFNAQFCIYNVSEDLNNISVMFTYPNPDTLEQILEHFAKSTREERYFKDIEERRNEIRVQRELDILNKDEDGRYTIIAHSGSMFAPQEDLDDRPF